MHIERTSTETVLTIPNSMLDVPQVQHLLDFIRAEVERHPNTVASAALAPAESPGARFEKLFAQWKSEAGFQSDGVALTSHKAYKSIINMGEAAVPFILMKLETDPQHLFYALFKITGENPVPLKHAGDLEKMTADWLNWGQKKGFLS